MSNDEPLSTSIASTISNISDVSISDLSLADTSIADFEAAADALVRVLNAHKIPYAFCGDWEMMKLGARDIVADNKIKCIVGKGFGSCIHALSDSSSFDISSHHSDGVQRVVYLPSPTTRVIIDLLRAGEFGPKDLTVLGRTVVLSDSFTYLSPTELLRATVKACNSKRTIRDKDDIVWILRNRGEELDGERIDPLGDLTELAEEEEEEKEKRGIREAWRAWNEMYGDVDDAEDAEEEVTESDDTREKTEAFSFRP